MPYRTIAVLCGCAAGALAAPANLVADGDFEHAGLTVDRGEQVGRWYWITPRADLAQVTVVAGAGRGGSAGVRYTRTAPGSDNAHLDQIVRVQPDAIYELTAWVRGDGHLQPLLSVTTRQWRPLATDGPGASDQWRRVRLVFSSFEHREIRVEWFPGADGKLYTGGPGTCALDDVRLAPLDPVPPAVRQAFELVRPRAGDEVSPARPPGAVGHPLPLRPMAVRNGVLCYQDGGEVALLGVNFQTALSWEYQGRLKPLGVPLTPEALKKLCDGNLGQLAPLGAGAVRMHLLPSDFSGPGGELRDTVYLDSLDYTIARCRERGIYVYLTLVNAMNTAFCGDSFMVGHDREEWLCNPAVAQPMQRYLAELLSHRNRYSGLRYADDPTIGVIEVMNEPAYPTYAELRDAPRWQPVRGSFERWCAEQGAGDAAAVVFTTWRYQTVRDFIDRCHATIRGTGARQPVVWNLNWPGMISAHEDVYQAAADSRAEAVSFCCYPGQSDVPAPFWDHPMDLSGRNYLPYLAQCQGDYRQLRWALGRRFAGQAKLVYEFETFYNQTTYLYPAMAALFRALGAQIALMWNYGLMPAAEYLGGSHYLSLYCTPRKAVSFHIASRVFAETPRCTPVDLRQKTELVAGRWAVSQTRDLAIWCDGDTVLHTGPLDWTPLPLPAAPRHLNGYGRSPWLDYDGRGAYQVDVADGLATLEVLPDATWLRPPWQRGGRAPWPKLCQLEPAARHRLTWRVPGVPGTSVARLHDGQAQPVASTGPPLSFEVTAGRYQIR